VEELALKSRIRRKRANMAKESNDKADVIVDAIQSNSLKVRIYSVLSSSTLFNSTSSLSSIVGFVCSLNRIESSGLLG